MKICMIIWKYYPCLEGGAERQCRKLVGELAQRGDECTVVTGRLKGCSATKETPFDNVEIVRIGFLSRLADLPDNIWTALRKMRFTKLVKSDALKFWFGLPFVWLARLSFMLALKKYIHNNRDSFDILHVHEAHWIAAVTAWASDGLGIPVVCKEASYPYTPHLSYDTPFRKMLADYRGKLYFIAITEAIKKSLIEHGINKHNISLLPNGVEVPSEKASVIGSNKVVYVGNFVQTSRRKAFDILFDAWSLVHQKHPFLKLVVLGGGDSSFWEKYVVKKKCDASVQFVGMVPDVGKYLESARIFVLPSRLEGLSNALLEAMSWGVPVVISNIPTHSGLVENRVNGLVVPVNDSEALAEAILEVADNDSLALELSENASETIRAEYSLVKTVNRLKALYIERVEMVSDY